MITGLKVLEAGVEPATNSLGNCCSIQLSYPSIVPVSFFGILNGPKA